MSKNPDTIEGQLRTCRNLLLQIILKHNGCEKSIVVPENFEKQIREILKNPPPEETNWSRLKKLVGYVENGSDQTVSLYLDDATKAAFVEIGPHRKRKQFYSSNFEKALEYAIAKEQGHEPNL